MSTHRSGSDGAVAELDRTIRPLADLGPRAREGLWCGGVGGGIPASSNLLDHGASGLLPVALALVALFAAFAWMVRRWGACPPALPADGSAVPRALPADSPATTPGALPPQPRSADRRPRAQRPLAALQA